MASVDLFAAIGAHCRWACVWLPLPAGDVDADWPDYYRNLQARFYVLTNVSDGFSILSPAATFDARGAFADLASRYGVRCSACSSAIEFIDHSRIGRDGESGGMWLHDLRARGFHRGGSKKPLRRREHRLRFTGWARADMYWFMNDNFCVECRRAGRWAGGDELLIAICLKRAKEALRDARRGAKEGAR